MKKRNQDMYARNYEVFKNFGLPKYIGNPFYINIEMDLLLIPVHLSNFVRIMA